MLHKVKYFLKNFFKKFSQFLLTFASGYDIIEERVQIKKNKGHQSPPTPQPFIIPQGAGKSQVFLIKKIKKFFVKYLANICSLYSK